MPEEQSSQMSKCAFPPWLLNNNHTSFTLIKIKFLLLLFLPRCLYTSVTTTCFSLNYPPSFSSVSRPPIQFASMSSFFSLIVSWSLSSGTFLTPRHVSFVLVYPSVCASWWQNIGWENEGEHNAVVCSISVNPVMIYGHSIWCYLAIMPGSQELGRW